MRIMATDKTHKIPNAPNLRFPGFEGEWKETVIGDVADVIGGGTPDTTVSSYWDGDIAWFTPTEIGHNKYVRKSKRTISEKGLCNSSAKLLPLGAILLTTRATIGETSITLNACTTNQGFQSLISKSNIDNEFLYYLIGTKKKDLFEKACGSTFMEISANEVRKIRIKAPTKQEQVRIAKFLAILDKRIETQIGAINKHESLIKAIAGELTCEGEKVRLADLVDCHSSTMQENDITNDGPYPVYGATGICGYTDSPMCKEDAIIIVKDGSGVGNIKFVSGGFSILGTLCYLTAKQDVSIGYVYCCLVNFDFSPYKTGMAIPHIYFKDYGKGEINIKNAAEQQKTRTLVLSLMNKLDVERQLLKQYKLQKQYLLSQMFV